VSTRAGELQPDQPGAVAVHERQTKAPRCPARTPRPHCRAGEGGRIGLECRNPPALKTGVRTPRSRRRSRDSPDTGLASRSAIRYADRGSTTMTQGTSPDWIQSGRLEHGRSARPASVRAALSVLELLGERGARPLAELSRELGLLKSTLRRICAVLLDRGWAFRDATARFDLGIRALGLRTHSAELPIVIGFRSLARRRSRSTTKACAWPCWRGPRLCTSRSRRPRARSGSRPTSAVARLAFASASGQVILPGVRSTRSQPTTAESCSWPRPAAACTVPSSFGRSSTRCAGTGTRRTRRRPLSASTPRPSRS
jgi:hypothetical protein